jgi:carotenoid cleavage dioxygenase-like enzyme
MTKFYLQGNFAPVPDEATAFDLPVEGAVPEVLEGRYLRNGPNPRAGDAGHWFFGEGMIHGVELRGGRATWFRNRHVRTPSFEQGRPIVGENGLVDVSVNVANTNVIAHGGRILALAENTEPTEVGRELDTIGGFDFGGRLRTAMTAHPKRCPVTGELHFFGYGYCPPFLTYHRADAAGNLVQSEVIEVPGATMIHDFAITEHSVVFMDLPVVFDPMMIMSGTMPFHWSDDYGARIGIMPRGGSNADVRWFEVEPCYVFHPLNAVEDPSGQIEVDVVRYPYIWRADQEDFPPATLHRWTVDTATGSVKEQPLDDQNIEFPRVDERRVGRPHRYGYAVNGAAEGLTFGTALTKYDLVTDSFERHDFGPGRSPGEAVFVPACDGASEDEGYVLTYVYDAGRDGSDLVILDASDFAATPVATIGLPQRVPYGYHGNWVADAELAQELQS